jgi:hypothetical protein
VTDFVEEVQRGALRGLRLASTGSIVTALTFTIVYKVNLPSRFPVLLPSLLGMILLGATRVFISYTSFGKAHPRSLSVLLAMFINVLLVANQLGVGSHSYGHSGVCR